MKEILNYKVESPYQRVLRQVDHALWSIASIFQHLANMCLLLMLVLTSATIILRPFGLSAYWIWPWTMVLFIWLCFLGFCAFFVQLKDVRVDFIAQRLGKTAIAATRLLSDFCTLAVSGTLLWQMPTFLEKSQGIVDGALLPGGEELFRQALSIPLLLSLIIIAPSALLDLLKMIVGLPENLPDSVVED
nr:TRAP transporter small permease subunit [uncultured Cohaesibacter sp.]